MSLMATNPIGNGTKNLTVNIPDDLDRDLRKLAAASKMKLGPYIRALLEEARREKVLYQAKIERLKPEDQQ
jgi:hypothetical protein